MAYEKTYNTLEKISEKVLGKDKNVFLIGGISAAIQTGTDLYRQNEDLDLMVDTKELVDVLTALKEMGYKAYDRRGIKTQNTVGMDGKFIAMSHEIDVDSTDRDMLGIGIFTYERSNGKVITHSYTHDQRDGVCRGTKKVMPEELFDLMYSQEAVEYKGMQLKTSSKEFVYLSKSRGDRPKDKQDADVLRPYIDEDAKKRIARIQQLEKRTKVYREIFGEDGEIVETVEEPSYPDKVHRFIENWTRQNQEIQPENLCEALLSNQQVQRMAENDSDIRAILDKLKEVKPAKSAEEFSKNAKRVTELYCYSDNFEKDFQREFGEKDERDEHSI